MAAIDEYDDLLEFAVQADENEALSAIKNYRNLGKFSTLVDELVYLRSLDSNETIGNTEDFGHYTLVHLANGDTETAVRWFYYLANGADAPNLTGAVVIEDSRGFVDVEYYSDPSSLTARWAAIDAEYDEFIKCDKCSGTGTIEVECSECDGQGEVYPPAHMDGEPKTCIICDGDGVVDDTCDDCGGVGYCDE